MLMGDSTDTEARTVMNVLRLLFYHSSGVQEAAYDVIPMEWAPVARPEKYRHWRARLALGRNREHS
jgi:hypothetical protein